ncbi:hypothetical protein AB0O76_05905 [Streptomyces sp. NPDC086554]
MTCLIVTGPLEFSFNLPQRTVGRHVLLVEIDLPDTADVIYQSIDINYTN